MGVITLDMIVMAMMEPALAVVVVVAAVVAVAVAAVVAKHSFHLA